MMFLVKLVVGLVIISSILMLSAKLQATESGQFLGAALGVLTMMALAWVVGDIAVHLGTAAVKRAAKTKENGT